MPLELVVMVSQPIPGANAESAISAALDSAIKAKQRSDSSKADSSSSASSIAVCGMARVSDTTFSCTVSTNASAVIPRRIYNIVVGSDEVDSVSARVFVNPRAANLLQQQKAQTAVNNAKVFVVGAGGIGCELLKNLFLAGWRDIEVIDMDTIDATNLNRQFLFRPEDVGKPKSATAASRVLSWERAFASGGNDHGGDDDDDDDDDAAVRRKALRIQSHHGNVKDPVFSTEWISQFSVVINGLDNVSARKHVNRLCIEANIPLVESGTMGYNGQAQPIRRGKYQCYDCHPKTTEQKVFAVCTIHSKPTSIVHCVHYARELYGRLFGDNVSSGASEFDFVNEALAKKQQQQQTASSDEDLSFEYARLLSDAVFNDKIKQLIELRHAKNNGEKSAVENDAAAAAAAAPSTAAASNSNGSGGGPHPINVADYLQGIRSGFTKAPDEHETSPSIAGLLALLFDSVKRCRARDRTPFDKNDDTSALFIAAATNLRAANFGIAAKSAFEIRTIAGNIVPAIASTNAAIGACAVHLATQLLLEDTALAAADSSSSSSSSSSPAAQFVAMRQHPTRRKRILASNNADGAVKKTIKTPATWERLSLSSFPSGAPQPNCIVCRPSKQNILLVKLDATLHTLGDFVGNFLMREMGLVSPCIHTATGTLYEHGDYEKRAGDSMTCFVPVGANTGQSKCRFEVDDLNQALEWTVDVVHEVTPSDVEGEVTAFRHTVVSSAAAAADPTSASSSAVASGSSQQQQSANNNNNNTKNSKVNNDDDDDEVIAFHPSAKHQHRADSVAAHTRQREENNHHDGSSVPQNGAAASNHSRVIEVDD